MVTILYKRLVPEAQPPKRAHAGDAGWDVTAVRKHYYNDRTIVYGTGLAFAVPPGHWLDARARSSIYKMGLMLCNGVGTIDSSYRGEVGAMFYQLDPHGVTYEPGDRVLQLIPMPCRCDEVEFVETAELPASWDGRGQGGFGSTGK